MLNNSLRKIAKGAGVSFIGAFIGMTLSYLSRMIIARWLGASDYGLISLALAAMTIGATLSLVGLPVGIIFMLLPTSLFQSAAHNNPRLHHPTP